MTIGTTNMFVKNMFVPNLIVTTTYVTTTYVTTMYVQDLADPRGCHGGAAVRYSTRCDPAPRSS